MCVSPSVSPVCVSPSVQCVSLQVSLQCVSLQVCPAVVRQCAVSKCVQCGQAVCCCVQVCVAVVPLTVGGCRRRLSQALPDPGTSVPARIPTSGPHKSPPPPVFQTPPKWELHTSAGPLEPPSEPQTFVLQPLLYIRTIGNQALLYSEERAAHFAGTHVSSFVYIQG